MNRSLISAIRPLQLAPFAVWLAGMWLAPGDAPAATLRHAEHFVLPATETLHDDLYAMGKVMDIEGTVDGDLVVAGQTVTIGGTVTGDVLAAAREVIISGHVGGTVRVTGSNITVSGDVAHDLLAGCGNLVVGTDAKIGRDVLAGAGSSSFSGRIDRDVRVGSGTATFSGSVGGTVYARAKEVHLTESAVLERDLLVTSQNEVSRAAGAKVAGQVQRRIPKEHDRGNQFGRGAVGWVRGLIGFLIFGALLHLLFASASSRASDVLRRSPLASLGLGVLLSCGIPCAAAALFVVGILVGGWWIALGAIGVYILLLAAGYVMAANHIGTLVLARGGKAPAYGLSLLTGLVILGVVVLIPFLGWLLGWAAGLLGVGALAIAWYGTRPKAATAPAI